MRWQLVCQSGIELLKIIREERMDEHSSYILVQGPLKHSWKMQVVEAWGEYDSRILNPEEWDMEFEKGLLGPAWHSMIINNDAVVAHCAVIPVEYTISQRDIIGGVPEALIVINPQRGDRFTHLGRPGFASFVLIQQTMRSIKDLGLSFGLFTQGRWPGLWDKIGGCTSVDIPFKTSILVTNWLLYRRGLNRHLRIRDYLLHVVFMLYSLFLGWVALLVGRRISVRAVEEFNSELDAELIHHLREHTNSVVSSSAYLNSKFWGDSYIKVALGEPIIGYIVFRRPKQTTVAPLIVDYYMRQGGLGFRRSLYVGKLIRKLLCDSGIGYMSAQTFQIGPLAKCWSRMLTAMGFVDTRRNEPVQLTYYSNVKDVTLDERWHVTYLFRERL